MKKLFAIIVTAAVCASLGGCDNSSDYDWSVETSESLSFMVDPAWEVKANGGITAYVPPDKSMIVTYDRIEVDEADKDEISGKNDREICEYFAELMLAAADPGSEEISRAFIQIDGKEAFRQLLNSPMGSNQRTSYRETVGVWIDDGMTLICAIIPLDTYNDENKAISDEILDSIEIAKQYELFPAVIHEE